MSPATFQPGEHVTVGNGSPVYPIDHLEDREDAAGDPYVMAFLRNSRGELAMVETSRLHRAKVAAK